MKVKVKKLHPDAKIYSYAKNGDAGIDLVATSLKMDEYGNAHYGTGLAFEIPKGFVGLVFPRSSVAKKNQTLTNCVGVVDSGYRGEVTLKFKPTQLYLDSLLCSDYKLNVVNTEEKQWTKRQRDNQPEVVGDSMYAIGDAIGQIIIIPYPEIELEEAEELSITERGSGAYGSSGH